MSPSHLQHVTDVEDGTVLSGVHVRADVTVFVLHRHTPACKFYHLPSMCSVEVKQWRLLQGDLGGGGRGTCIENAYRRLQPLNQTGWICFFSSFFFLGQCRFRYLA